MVTTATTRAQHDVPRDQWSRSGSRDCHHDRPCDLGGRDDTDRSGTSPVRQPSWTRGRPSHCEIGRVETKWIRSHRAGNYLNKGACLLESMWPRRTPRSFARIRWLVRPSLQPGHCLTALTLWLSRGPGSASSISIRLRFSHSRSTWRDCSRNNQPGPQVAVVAAKDHTVRCFEIAKERIALVAEVPRTGCSPPPRPMASAWRPREKWVTSNGISPSGARSVATNRSGHAARICS